MKKVVRTHGNFGMEMINEMLESNSDLLIWQDNYEGLFDDTWIKNNYIPFWKVKDIYDNGDLERIVLTPFYIADNVIDEILALGIPKEMIFVYEGRKEGRKAFIQS